MSGLGSRERSQQLRNERDPVPGGHLALVVIERCSDRSTFIIEAQEP